MRRLLVAAVCAAGLVVPASAGATVPISKFVSQPLAPGAHTIADCNPDLPAASGTATAAATHRDYCVSLAFDTATDDVKDLTISLPAGVVGDPGATSSRCPRDTFQTGGCDPATRVGDVSSDVTVDPGSAIPVLGSVLSSLLSIPATITGEVYNLVPAPGQPALLGISLDGGLVGGLSPVRLQVPIRVRVPDAGLDSVTQNVPNNQNGIGVHVHTMSLMLWGKNHHDSLAKPFMSLPTRCDVPAASAVTLKSYGGQTSTKNASFAVSDCASVPFTPDLEVGPTTTAADSPGEAWAKLIVPTGDTGTGDNARRQAYLKDVALQLPAGLALNPPLANGLIPCTPEQFAQDKDAEPGCPDSTVMGRVEFRTPIFPGEVLSGKVYFGTPLPGRPLVNFISVEDARLRVKLVGYATIDPQTTAITAHFEDQPQVPFESFKFIYTDPGDGRATLTSPVGCGTYPVTAAMTPWGGGAAVSPTRTFDVVDCPPKAFTPTISATTSGTQAGADTALNVHIERPDRQLRLEQLTVSLPPGLTGRLPAVPACPVADARASACSDASQVGTAAVAVGTGPQPLKLPGKVFLTDGFDGGIAGLAVIVDTKVPALDLGKVAVLQKLVVRPDTGIDVVSEKLPQSLEGIPTVYRSIDLTIDRPGFMRNATSCAPQAIHATFSSVGGEMTAASDAPYQATACDALPFAPALDASVGAPGETAKGKHPPLTVVVRQGAGQAAMKRALVTLPLGINVDLINLSVACTDAQLDAGACPAASRIGSVRADTPLLRTPLSGGAYLMQPKPGQLPGIALDLSLVRLRGSVSFTPQGRLTTQFDGIPDVPLTRLVLQLAGGPKAALRTSQDICSTNPVVDSTFVSQGDVSRSVSSAATVVGCKALKGSVRLTGVKRRRPAATFDVTSITPLKELRIGLPKSLRAAAAKQLRKHAKVTGDGHRLKSATVRWRKGRLVIGRLAGARHVRVVLGGGALRQRGTIKPGRTLRFPITGVDTKGAAKSARLAAKAKR